jgi:hypothetical protein
VREEKDQAMPKRDIPETERAAFISCKSHRARDRVLREIGQDRQSYYAWDRPNSFGTYPVTAAELATLRSIPRLNKAFTIPRIDPTTFARCWG